VGLHFNFANKMHLLTYISFARYNLYCIFDVLKPNSVLMSLHVSSVCHRHFQGSMLQLSITSNPYLSEAYRENISNNCMLLLQIYLSCFVSSVCHRLFQGSMLQLSITSNPYLSEAYRENISNNCMLLLQIYLSCIFLSLSLLFT
jgi:hypothetical protein